MRVHYEFRTGMTPDEVISVFTDFSEGRPNVWPNLDPAKYRVHERGDTWAVVSEGSSRPALWARERYDWSVPGQVSWKAEESNFCAPGSGVVLTAVPDGVGGSRVRVDWERKLTSPVGYLVAIAVRLAKDRVLGYKAVLDDVQTHRSVTAHAA